MSFIGKIISRLPHDAAAIRGEPAILQPSYFLTGEQISTQAHDIVQLHPDLARVVTIGHSVQGRPLEVLRLGTQQAVANRNTPRALVIAGIHPWEIANTPSALRWSGQAVDDAARGGSALENRVVDVLLSANPDGHFLVERAFAGDPAGNLRQRLNANGVDLNRNFDFHWGEGPYGSQPGSDEYHGPSAASEPETQANQQLALETLPRVVLDLHSAGNELIMPPAYARQPVDPDVAAMGSQIAEAGGYHAISGWEYMNGTGRFGGSPTTGVSQDWMHARIGAAGYDVESGQRILQNDAQFEAGWPAINRIINKGVQLAGTPRSH